MGEVRTTAKSVLPCLSYLMKWMLRPLGMSERGVLEPRSRVTESQVADPKLRQSSVLNVSNHSILFIHSVNRNKSIFAYLYIHWHLDVKYLVVSF